MRRLLPAAAALCAAVLVPALPATAATPRETPLANDAPGKAEVPLVFGHRGASGYRPEHTLASYALAARMGADVIEPDLVPTRDDQLVVRHEPEISGTTDVAEHPEFASRRRTQVIDGVSYTGWFTQDFTLKELKTLRAKERLPALRQHNTIYDGRYEIPTFQEVLDLRARLSRELHRTIGVAPETKHPTYFKAQGHDTTPLLVRALRRNGLATRRSPVFIQSFEVGNLEVLNRQVGDQLVQLLSASGSPGDTPAGGTPTYAQLSSKAGLRGIARYADWASPDYQQLLPRDAANASLPASSFVADAHAAGLKVVPYTVRAENDFLPTDLRRGTDPAAFGDVLELFRRLFAQHIDAIFSDQPDIAVEARPKD